jgi:hypothetical protein
LWYAAACERSVPLQNVSLWLNKDVDPRAVLIHRTPEIMLGTVDLQEHLVKDPFVAYFRAFPLELGGVGRSEHSVQPQF